MIPIFFVPQSSLLFSHTMEIHTGFLCNNDVIIKSSAIGKDGGILLAGEFEGGDLIYGKVTLTNWGKDIFLACFDKNLKYKWMKKQAALTPVFVIVSLPTAKEIQFAEAGLRDRSLQPER